MPVEVPPESIYEHRPHAGVHVVVSHSLDEHRLSPVGRQDGLQQPFRVVERHYAVLRPVDEEDRTAYTRREVYVREAIPREGASRVDDYPVDGEEGGVEDEAADGIAVLGAPGREETRRSRPEGPAVENYG